VLQQPPITYKCKDAVNTAAAFVDCLHSRLPSLCGHQLNYTARPLYPIVGLTTALHCSNSPTNVLPVRRNVTNSAALDLSTSLKSAVSESNPKPSHPTFPVNKPSPSYQIAFATPITQSSVSAVSPNTELSHNKTYSTVTDVLTQKSSKLPALFPMSTASHKV